MSPISAVTTGPPCSPALNSGTSPYWARYRSLCSWMRSLTRKTQRRQLPWRKSPLGRPGHHHLVADVLVDLAARLQHGLRHVVEEVVLEVVEPQRAQALGDRRGVVQVQEHEDAILRDGTVIAAEQEVHQRAGSEHAVELPDEVDEEAGQRKADQGHDEPAAQHEISILLRSVVSERAAVLEDAEQTSRHGVDGDRTQGDVEEGADEEEAADRRART